MTIKKLKKMKKGMFLSDCKVEDLSSVETYFRESVRSLMDAVKKDDSDALKEAKELFHGFHVFPFYCKESFPGLDDNFRRDALFEIQAVFSRRREQTRNEFKIDRLDKLVCRYRSVRSAFEGLFRSFAEYPADGLWEEWGKVDLGELMAGGIRGGASWIDEISHPLEAVFSLRAAHITDDLESLLGFPGWLGTDHIPMDVLQFPSPGHFMRLFADLSKQANKEGLLALEDHIEEIKLKTPLIGLALQFVVEDIDSKLVETLLNKCFARLDLRLLELEEMVKESLRPIDTGDRTIITKKRINIAVLETIMCSSEGDCNEYSELAPILTDLKFGLKGIEEVSNCPQIHTPLTEIIKGTHGYSDLSEDRIALLFSRLREEASYAHSLLMEGVRHLDKAGEWNLLMQREDEVLLPLWKKQLPGSLLGFSQFVAENHSHPQPVFRALERMFGELVAFLSEDGAAQDDPAKVMEEDARRLCRAGSIQELLYVPAGVEQLSRERKQRCEEQIRRENSAEQRLLDAMKEPLLQAETGYARRHPSPENIDAFMEKEKLMEFSLELIKLYVQRRSGDPQAQESERALDKKSRELLGFSLTESPDKTKRNFEAELALLIFPYSREKFDAFISGHFSDKRSKSILGGYLFSFDRIAGLSDRALQMVFLESDPADMAAALYECSGEVKEKFLRNASARREAMLRAEMEESGPVSPKQSRKAQRRIAEIMQRLHDNGEIVLSGDERSTLRG